MAEKRQYKIRSDMKAETKDPFRVYLNYTTLVDHGLKPGTACLLTSQDGRSFMATAWNPEKQLDGHVISVSRAFLEMHDLKLADRVSIEKRDEQIETAESITVYENMSDESQLKPLLDSTTEEQQSILESMRTQRFQKSPNIAVGMSLEVNKGQASNRTLTISYARPVLPYRAIYKVSTSTSIKLTSELAAKSEVGGVTLSLSDEGIGGLGPQLHRLRRLIEAYSDSSRVKRYKVPIPALQGGILLYGRPGTGKSLLLESIAAAGWQRTFKIQQEHFAGKCEKFRNVIDEALKLEPSVILMDRLEGLLGPRDERTRMDVLVEEFQRTTTSRVLIVGVTSNIRDVPEPLRQRGFFQRQVNIPVPDSKARAEILKVLCNEPKDQKHEMLDTLASRTHGFVGDDLGRLFDEAYEKADERIMREVPLEIAESLRTTKGDVPEDKKIMIEPEQADWEQALIEIRPSAMNDVFIETPETRWTDIGGYHHVKKELRFAIDKQIRYADEWAAFHVEPTKGILLYGPPGCSKTLIAKAIATETGLNFLAVKGAEVLDKYVGESERKLREIFDTARAASPSVVFFDEIDAIGASRGSAEGGAHGGLHLLTTLLNELDGIEARKNVFVVAATNRPEVLDPALMRPGRLDRHILVDLPDAEARREIIEGMLAKVPYPLQFDGLNYLVGATEGYSGAEVVNILHQAFDHAMEERMETGRTIVLDQRCFEYALGRVEPQTTQETADWFKNWSKRSARGGQSRPLAGRPIEGGSE